MGDHRADHEQNPGDSGHRHHDGCDVERSGRDQANRSQELELERIVFAAGLPVARRAAFVHPSLPNNRLISPVSSAVCSGRWVDFDQRIPWVAQVVVAAAAGAVPAMAIDIELRSEDIGVNLMTLALSSPQAGTSAAR